MNKTKKELYKKDYRGIFIVRTMFLQLHQQELQLEIKILLYAH